MHQWIAAVFFLLCSANLANANWGGFNYGNVATGNFKASGTESIEVKSEKLKIYLYNGWARVDVSYSLKNTGEAVLAKAGFPSVSNLRRNTDWGWGQKEKKNYKEIAEYNIRSDGKHVAFWETKPEWADWLKISRGSYLDYVDGAGEPIEDKEEWKDERPVEVSWFVSEVNFGEKENHTIDISYVSRYAQEGVGGETAYDYDAQRFLYILSTGSVWKGPIKKGEVEIHPVVMGAERLTIKPADRFVRKGDAFYWKFKDLEPNETDNIEVCLNDGFSVSTVSPTARREAKWFSTYPAIKRKYGYFNDCEVVARSKNATVYPASNLVDGTERAWVAGGDKGGVGESVTFSFESPRDISMLGISSGMTKSYELYKANNRPKKIAITVDDKQPVIFELADEHLFCCDNDDRSFQWISLPNTNKSIKRLVVKFLDVYKGEKYDDLCISEVLFGKKLKQGN